MELRTITCNPTFPNWSDFARAPGHAGGVQALQHVLVHARLDALRVELLQGLIGVVDQQLFQGVLLRAPTLNRSLLSRVGGEGLSLLRSWEKERDSVGQKFQST